MDKCLGLVKKIHAEPKNDVITALKITFSIKDFCILCQCILGSFLRRLDKIVVIIYMQPKTKVQLPKKRQRRNRDTSNIFASISKTRNEEGTKKDTKVVLITSLG